MYTTKDIKIILNLLLSVPQKYKSEDYFTAIHGAIVGIEKYEESKTDVHLPAYLSWWIKTAIEKEEKKRGRLSTSQIKS